MAGAGLEDVEQLTRRLDNLVERIDALLEKETGGNVQTVIHKSTGIGPWGAAAVCACFMTYLALVLFALWSVFQINNLTAWKDVYGRELAAIKQQINQEKRP